MRRVVACPPQGVRSRAARRVAEEATLLHRAHWLPKERSSHLCRRSGGISGRGAGARGADQCQGYIADTAHGTACRRANLMAGRAPRARVTAPPIGRPARPTLRQWLTWRGLLPSQGGEGGEVDAALPAICSALVAEEVQVEDLVNG